MIKYLVHELGFDGHGLNAVKAINAFAKDQNLKIVGNPKKWLTDLYNSGSNKIIYRRSSDVVADYKRPIGVQKKRDVAFKRRNRVDPVEREKDNQRKAEIYKKENKRRATPAERALLRALKLNDVKFQFQKAFYDSDRLFIVDFYVYCELCHLVVEVDGGYHDQQKQYDEYRQKWLESKRHCKVIRFTNEEVLKDIDVVMNKISAFKPQRAVIKILAS